MSSEIKAINRLTDVNSKVSCHYFIKKDGSIINIVPDSYIAWHAGKSNWKSFTYINKYSIGIEIQNSGHGKQYSNFTSKQINSLIKLCKNLKKKFNIKNQNILGHSDISYDRKKDPGEKFPWKRLAAENISIWHNLDESYLLNLRNHKIIENEKNKFFANLKKIGYFLEKGKKNRKKLILAFQRRFRNNLINGVLDRECLEITNKLCRN